MSERTVVCWNSTHTLLFYIMTKFSSRYIMLNRTLILITYRTFEVVI